MPSCQSHFHPQVPVSCCTLTLVYCHRCMAWRLMYGSATQQGDEELDRIAWFELDYGPFDELGDIFAEATALMREDLAAPGRPWDHRASAAPLGPDLEGDGQR